MEQLKEFTMIPMDRLLNAIGDPFEVHRITREMVQHSLRFGTYEIAHEAYGREISAVERDPEWHAQRVAYLVQYGWNDPIELDVGIPSLGFVPYPLIDGHHRTCAAIIRGDKEIKAEVAGAVDYAKQLFGVDCSLYG
jgi:hypothetical protein